jgi:predicted nuclease of predicted toxin-antitoxin system
MSRTYSAARDGILRLRSSELHVLYAKGWQMVWKKLPLTVEADSDWRAAKQTKFLADESISRDVTAFLREKKLNVKDIFDEGLAGRSDEDVFAFAWRDRRVLLTHDRDFLDNQRFPEHRNPGVVVLPGGDGDQTALGYGVHRVCSVFSKDPEAWQALSRSAVATSA